MKTVKLEEKEYEFLTLKLRSTYALIKETMVIEIFSVLTKRKLITILNNKIDKKILKSKQEKIKKAVKQRFFKFKPNTIYIAYLNTDSYIKKRLMFLSLKMLQDLKKKGVKIKENRITINML